jgi:S-adenosyl-L-methionine hydrolase (adenosine-forming)
MASPLITFTSDYGLEDEYVGSVKGVLLGLCPGAVIVDLTHEIEPQDIEAGAGVLRAAFESFPDGTVHLAVIDPGVGGPRKAIAARTKGAFWVGPDNGLFSGVFERDGPAAVVEIDRRRVLRPSPSIMAPSPIASLAAATFDGRDLFAPAAAMLANGRPLRSLGRSVTRWVRLPDEAPRVVRVLGSVSSQTGKGRAGRPPDRSPGRSKERREAFRLMGRVVRVDRFGNLITNIAVDHLAKVVAARRAPRLTVTVGRRRVKLFHYYDEAECGSVGALINSSGYLEIFGTHGSAFERLGIGKGAMVTVESLK